MDSQVGVRHCTVKRVHLGAVSDVEGEQKLQEIKCCATTREQVVDALRVAGASESGAPRVERALEGRNAAEMITMHAKDDGRCSEFLLVEASSRVEDVSVLMKSGAEKVGSPENRSLETVTILMSLGLVLVNFKVAELFCEGRFGDAECIVRHVGT